MTTPPEVTNESIAQKKLSAAEWRAKRDLEEARKQGTAAPEIDEEGNAINPHIPQYSTLSTPSLFFWHVPDTFFSFFLFVKSRLLHGIWVNKGQA